MFEFIDTDAVSCYLKSEEKVIFIFESPWSEKCEQFIYRILTIPEDNLVIPIYRVELDADGGDYLRKRFRIKEEPTAILFIDGAEDKRTTREETLYTLLID